MSIRYLAEELYRLTKRLEELERAVKALGEGSSSARARLEAELVQTRNERERVRSVLEAKKEKPIV